MTRYAILIADTFGNRYETQAAASNPDDALAAAQRKGDYLPQVGDRIIRVAAETTARKH